MKAATLRDSNRVQRVIETFPYTSRSQTAGYSYGRHLAERTHQQTAYSNPHGLHTQQLPIRHYQSAYAAAAARSLSPADYLQSFERARIENRGDPDIPNYPPVPVYDIASEPYRPQADELHQPAKRPTVALECTVCGIDAVGPWRASLFVDHLGLTLFVKVAAAFRGSPKAQQLDLARYKKPY
ncbi:MAG: hypothetical protein CYPHOPRED_001563, partial [Cyphobasidiales sp. Tagirdzhanova-0007]